MSDHIVIGDRVLLDASFRDAQARLEMLVHDGMAASFPYRSPGRAR